MTRHAGQSVVVELQRASRVKATMGMSSAVHHLDFTALQDELGPAFRKLVARSTSDPEQPQWLSDLLAAEFERAIRAEDRYPDHYALQHRYSDDLEQLRWGLGVDMFGDCSELRPDLALRDHLLLGADSSIHGGCRSSTCGGRTSCPLHAAGQHRVQAEVLMRLVQKAFEARCLGQPQLLGAHGRWYDFRSWYAMELGKDGSRWSDSELVRYAERDLLLRLLLRLSKRGALIGCSEGGDGEGLLGWLDPEETLCLAETLASRLLSPDVPLPDELHELEAHDANHYLPEMRQTLARLLRVAESAAEGRKGIALTRQ